MTSCVERVHGTPGDVNYIETYLGSFHRLTLMLLLFPLQCWMLLSLLLPTATAYIVRFKNK